MKCVRHDRAISKALRSGLVVAFVAFCVLRPGEARAEGDRSTALAYAIGGAGFVVPLWIGTELLPEGEEEGKWTSRSVAALSSIYASLAWGTSAGYFYSGNARYGVIAGLGKTALLGAGAAAVATFESGRHPYIFASSFMLAAGWSLADYALLYRDVRIQNERRQSQGPPAPTAQAGVWPELSLSPSGLTLGLSGRF